jgi:putative tryptophan/tyrosine transport system substrate-binding protein
MKFVRQIFFLFALRALLFAPNFLRALCVSVVKPTSDLRLLISGLCALLFALCSSADAQQPKVYRVGVIYPGGPFNAVVEGLRDGLKELGLGKQVRLELRDSKGDLGAVREAAKAFEREKVNVIYAVPMGVVVAAKESTSDIPVVFVVGTDPIRSQLIQNFAKPGGRLTGIYYLASDLTPKRLEILKEILPKLRKVVTFYNPNNPVPNEAAQLGREAARQMKIQFIERHATSIDELRQDLQNIKPGEVDAYFYVSDAWITTQAQIIIQASLAKKLPTMFHEQSLVAAGGLASYGQNYHEIGRMSAKPVQKVLTGTHPQDLRVETADKFEMAINLKTAKQIGLTIPPNVLARADKVIR